MVSKKFARVPICPVLWLLCNMPGDGSYLKSINFPSGTGHLYVTNNLIFVHNNVSYSQTY